MTNATPPASGIQTTLHAGGYRAEIASIGASLRELRHDGRDLVVPFGADEIRPHYRGATLAPWPNRIVDGAYTLDGVDHVTALTEPERRHALHGLATWLDFAVVDAAEDRATLVATIVPQQGYPWRVRVESHYLLDTDGLVQTVSATNESAEPAPFGTGPHPYLVAGHGNLDTWSLALPAASVLEVTPDRLAPVALRQVEIDAARFDWRAGRALGAVEIDHAFTDIEWDVRGEATVRLTDPAGTGVEMTWGSECGWVQIHTADRPDGAADPAHRAGLAVEPMTCAPNAFNADRYDYGTGLILIAPGETVTASWRIRAI